MNITKTVLLCCVTAFTPLSSAMANEVAAPEEGEGQLQEIIVTAQKRSENMQKIPIAVTAFSDEAIDSRAITNIADLGPLTPGLKVDQGNGIVLPFLRGVGSTLTALGNESSVGIYIDGVYTTRTLPGLFSLGNIERVEVLKGPQSTLFGRNSTGGVIQIVTALPTEEVTVKGHVGYGNYDTITGDFYASGGLAPNLAVDISVNGTRQGDGFGTNIATGDRDRYQDDITVRSKLAFTPSDETRIIVSGYYTYNKTSANAATLPGTVAGFSTAPFVAQPNLKFFDQNTDIPNFIRGEQYGVSLTAEQEVGFASLKSISAYSHNEELGSFDLEKSPRPDGGAYLYSHLNQFTQELQLSSLSGSPVTWTVGGFYYYTDTAYEPAFLFGPLQFPTDVIGDGIDNGTNIHGQQKVKSISVYGQATYEVLPRLKFTAGARYVHDDVEGIGAIGLVRSNVETIVARNNPKYDQGKVTFKLAADYQIADSILGYATFSRGYKSGGFNLLPVPSAPYKAETIDAYEVGLKTQLFDNRMRLNLAGFWYDIRSPQVQLLNATSVLVANAGSARVKGLDLDGTLLVASGLTLNFGAAYLDSKYRDFTNAPLGVPVLVPPFGASNPLLSINAGGNYTPNASKFTATAGLTYNVASAIGDWTLVADYAYNDGYYFEPSNLFHQKAFSLVNANVELEPSEHLSVGLWVKNLFDKRYVAFQSVQAGPSGFPFTPAPPRRYGIRLGYKF